METQGILCRTCKEVTPHLPHLDTIWKCTRCGEYNEPRGDRYVRDECMGCRLLAWRDGVAYCGMADEDREKVWG